MRWSGFRLSTHVVHLPSFRMSGECCLAYWRSEWVSRIEVPPCCRGDIRGPWMLWLLAARISRSMNGSKNDLRSREDGPTCQLIPTSQNTTPSTSKSWISCTIFRNLASLVLPTESELTWQYIHLQTPSGRIEANEPSRGTTAFRT